MYYSVIIVSISYTPSPECVSFDTNKNGIMKKPDYNMHVLKLRSKCFLKQQYQKKSLGGPTEKNVDVLEYSRIVKSSHILGEKTPPTIKRLCQIFGHIFCWCTCKVLTMSKSMASGQPQIWSLFGVWDENPLKVCCDHSFWPTAHYKGQECWQTFSVYGSRPKYLLLPWRVSDWDNNKILVFLQ